MAEEEKSAAQVQSAIDASVEAHGGASYYVSHNRGPVDPNAKQIEGENLNSGEGPLLIEEAKAPAVVPPQRYIPMDKYIFINEKRNVKVYLEFPEDVVPENIVKQHIDDYSVEVIYAHSPDEHYRFFIQDLLHSIVLANSTIRSRNKKIIITLRKVNEKDNWYAIGKPLRS